MELCGIPGGSSTVVNVTDFIGIFGVKPFIGFPSVSSPRAVFFGGVIFSGLLHVLVGHLPLWADLLCGNVFYGPFL